MYFNKIIGHQKRTYNSSSILSTPSKLHHLIANKTHHLSKYLKQNRYHYQSQNVSHSHLIAMSAALGLSLSTYLNNYINNNNQVRACGIMGMISNDEEVVDYLLEGLTILQNRGYDSAGIA
eukprot:387182_1